jgi:hypothetical protein
VLRAVGCTGLAGQLPKEYGLLKNLEALEVSGAQLTSSLPNEWADAVALRGIAAKAFADAKSASARAASQATSRSTRFARSVSNDTGSGPSLAAIATQRYYAEARASAAATAVGALESVAQDANNGVQLGLMKLQVLVVQDHKMTGGLPEGYSRLQQLRVLDVSRRSGSSTTGLTGQLPPSYAALDNLQVKVVACGCIHYSDSKS